MGLYRRGRVWWMSFIYKRRRVRKSTETENQKLAQRIYDKVKGEIAEGKWFERSLGEQKTFREMIEKYVQEHIPPRSMKPYLANIKAFEKFFGDRPLKEITPGLVNDFRKRLKSEGAAVNTINHKIAVLKRMFSIAWKEWEWFDRNPIAQVSMEPGANKRDRWLTEQEEDSILSHSEAWMKEIVTFALNMGMRLGEVINLTWDNVDFLRRTVMVTQSKNNEPRTIPMNATVFEMLKEKSKVRSISCDKVFQTDNKPFKDHQIQYAFNKACERAGISDIHFHDLRHTFATRLVQDDKDLYKIQRLLGHKLPSMTQRYAHHSPESLRSCVDALVKPKNQSQFSHSLNGIT